MPTELNLNGFEVQGLLRAREQYVEDGKQVTVLRDREQMFKKQADDLDASRHAKLQNYLEDFLRAKQKITAANACVGEGQCLLDVVKFVFTEPPDEIELGENPTEEAKKAAEARKKEIEEFEPALVQIAF